MGDARLVRRIDLAAGLLAASVLADSAMEHDRGQFHDPFMYAPLASSAALLLAVATPPGRARRMRRAAFGLAGAVGLAGLGFHLFNVAKRPGGIAAQGLFYAAPLGAPAALTLAGLLGLLADRAGRMGRRALGRALTAISAAGVGGAALEVWILHFRGAFQDPFMWLPAVIPPAAAGLAAQAAAVPGKTWRRLARGWLETTAVLGVIGVAFHALGVHRNMGGWRNWRQTLLAGPPTPAPPAFTALALAGLAGLDLLEPDPREARRLEPRRPSSASPKLAWPKLAWPMSSWPMSSWPKSAWPKSRNPRRGVPEAAAA